MPYIERIDQLPDPPYPAVCRKEGKEIEVALFIIDLQESKVLGTYCCLRFPAIIQFVDLASSGTWSRSSEIPSKFRKDYCPESYILWRFVSSATDAKEMVRLGTVAVIWNVETMANKGDCCKIGYTGERLYAWFSRLRKSSTKFLGRNMCWSGGC